MHWAYHPSTFNVLHSQKLLMNISTITLLFFSREPAKCPACLYLYTPIYTHTSSRLFLFHLFPKIKHKTCLPLSPNHFISANSIPVWISNFRSFSRLKVPFILLLTLAYLFSHTPLFTSILMRINPYFHFVFMPMAYLIHLVHHYLDDSHHHL